MALKIDYSLQLPNGRFFPAKRKASGIAVRHRLDCAAYIIDRERTNQSAEQAGASRSERW